MRPGSFAWLLALSLALAPLEAHANMRAPRTLPHDGSSALYPVSDVVVLGEALNLDCSLRACEVSAIYSLRADAARQLELSFIVSKEARIRIDLAGTPIPSRVVVSEPINVRERDTLSPWERSSSPTLHRANFQLALPAGQSRLQIRYQQFGDGEEYDYGYFSDGEFIYQQRYEIWPLKEWRLADDFALDLSVRFRRDGKPSLWKRWFGQVDSVRCRDAHGARIGSELDRKAQSASFQARFERDKLPDRLLCDFGPERRLRSAYKR